MPLNLRPLPVAALFVAGAAGLVYVGADTGSRRDPDSNAPSIGRCVLHKKSPADDETERRHEILWQRLAVKDRAVKRLLAGQLTLLEAAAQCRDVEAAQPITWGPRIAATGPAEGERLCRMVIAMARGWMQQYVPAAAAAMTARLEADLERHRGPDGAIRLPD